MAIEDLNGSKIENRANFNYWELMTMDTEALIRRRGARRMADVPSDLKHLISVGQLQTVNLMEWLAADMALLAATLASQLKHAKLVEHLTEASTRIGSLGITERLRLAGSAIAGSGVGLEGEEFALLASHRSDLVRQWACYAVCDESIDFTLEQRLEATLPFAADVNMSVREAAWMAFRPHLQTSLSEGLPLLEVLSGSPSENVRRFAVEVSRPRSVWGTHITLLKRNPELAEPILWNVRADTSNYVRLAVGNWLNDAAKSRPDWVSRIAEAWTNEGDGNAIKIVKRGLRTLRREGEQARPDLFRQGSIILGSS